MTPYPLIVGTECLKVLRNVKASSELQVAILLQVGLAKCWVSWNSSPPEVGSLGSREAHSGYTVVSAMERLFPGSGRRGGWGVWLYTAIYQP